MDKIIKKKQFTTKKVLGYSLYTLLAGAVIFLIFFNDNSKHIYVDESRMLLASVSDGDFEEYVQIYGVVLPGMEAKKECETESEIMQYEFLDIDKNYLPKVEIIKPVFVDLNDLENDIIIPETEVQIIEDIHFKNPDKVNVKKWEVLLEEYNTKIEKKVKLLKEGKISEDDFQDALDYYTDIFENYYEDFHHEDNLPYDEKEIAYIETHADIYESINYLQDKISGFIASNPTFSINVMNDTSEYSIIISELVEDLGVQVTAEIHEKYGSKLQAGQTARLEYEGKTYELLIKGVKDALDDNFLLLDFSFDGDSNIPLQIGQAVPMKVVLSEEKESVMLKRGCFLQETGGHWVYVMDDEGKYAYKRNIKIGNKNDKFVEVVEGLAPGERVIISTYKYYKGKDKLIIK